jgi:hypothetical protein
VQAWYAAVEDAKANRRVWLSLTAAMANHLPSATWLTGAICTQRETGIDAELSGAAWSIDTIPMLTSAWASDAHTRGSPTLKSVRSVTFDEVPAVRFEMAFNYGGKGSASPEGSAAKGSVTAEGSR